MLYLAISFAATSLLKACALLSAIKAHICKIFVLRPHVDIHTKNIKYLLNTFIFGNKLRIPAG